MKFGIPKGTLFKTVIWSTIRMCKNNQNVWSIPTQFEKIFLLFSIFQKWTNDDQRITLSRIKLLTNFQTFLTLLLCSTVKPLKVCNINKIKIIHQNYTQILITISWKKLRKIDEMLHKSQKKFRMRRYYCEAVEIYNLCAVF